MHNDFISEFTGLLAKNGETSIHCRNIQVLMTETYKITHGLAPPIMDSALTKRENI